MKCPKLSYQFFTEEYIYRTQLYIVDFLNSYMHKHVKRFCFCILGDICSLPKVVGLCKALIQRYYYNTKTKKCEKFYYGGCGGNKNNFKTLSQCNGKCPPKGISES